MSPCYLLVSLRLLECAAGQATLAPDVQIQGQRFFLTERVLKGPLTGEVGSLQPV